MVVPKVKKRWTGGFSRLGLAPKQKHAGLEALAG
jgi:hypothetical protein